MYLVGWVEDILVQLVPGLEVELVGESKSRITQTDKAIPDCDACDHQYRPWSLYAHHWYTEGADHLMAVCVHDLREVLKGSQ